VIYNGHQFNSSPFRFQTYLLLCLSLLTCNVANSAFLRPIDLGQLGKSSSIQQQQQQHAATSIAADGATATADSYLKCSSFARGSEPG